MATVTLGSKAEGSRGKQGGRSCVADNLQDGV